MPWRPIFQLVEHRIHCLGHDPKGVRNDLAGALPLSPAAWAELTAIRRPVAVARPGIGATVGAP